MQRITEVVKHLIIINVILFIAFFYMMKEYWPMTFLFFPGSEAFQPYQLVSHMFMHGSEHHILFNMMTLFFLGPTVEQAMGAKRFLILYLACGVCAMGLHLFLAYIGFINPVPIVGASGAIVGVSIAFAVLFPNKELMLMFIPFPIKSKYLMLAFVIFDLVSGVGSFDTGIAHFAHLGGALCGFILSWYWYRSGPNISA